MAADFSSHYGLYMLFLLLAVLEVHAGEHCYSYSYPGMYCRYGCCGTGFDQYCCSMSVGVIIGGVIGGIACISVVITVICCCIKHTTYKGRVVAHRGVPASNVTVVHSNMTPMGWRPGGPQPMGGYAPPPPPMYAQPPPPYAYSNPAYPPGATPGGGVTGFAAPTAPAYPPTVYGGP